MSNLHTLPSIVVVSGLPRSGTSMMMNMLQAGGLEIVTDKLRAADDDNPRGYFEDERIKALDKSSDTAWMADAVGKVIKVISFLIRYLPAHYRYHVIFLEREMAEILASQQKMLIRRGKEPNKVDDAMMAASYLKHLQQVFRYLEEQPNFRTLRVQYRSAVDDPLGQARRVQEFLNLPLDISAMAAGVDPELYRNRG